MFKQLGLIGCGLMGSSLALALQRAGLVERVSGYSPSPATTALALKMGVIDSIATSAADAAEGADLFDISSGGLVTGVNIPLGPGYQVPLAQGVAAAVSQPVSAVGMITDPQQAEDILQNGVDVISIARQSLRDPYWPLRAAHELGADDVKWPWQYERGKFPKH